MIPHIWHRKGTLHLTYIEAFILGLIQGLAEFLPISSSGHLAILQHFFEIDGEKVLPFAVLLHVGTLISVFMVYWKDILALFRELGATISDMVSGKGLRLDSSPLRRLGAMIIVATIPTGIIGVLFNDLFASMYLSLPWIAIGLFLTGILLFFAERKGKKTKTTHREEGIKVHHALFVGVFQGIAIWPGVSRSGSTLVGGLLSGLDRNVAIKFAFLISIPSILGSVVMEAPDAFQEGLEASLIGPILLGMAVAAVSGFLAIKTMLRVVAGKRLYWFSIYVWTLAAALLLYIVLN
jgi:undecaprenyl-diphosphatase